MDDKNNNYKKDLNDNEKKPKEIYYIAVGIALGTALGVAFKNIGLGLAIGVAVGAGIDSQKSKKNDK
jgi:F0F1-type ATP synthase membrane subunit c/vacuolar-type H+-ATPase subunit K